MSGIRDVMSRIREDDVEHDPWGTSLTWHFAICDLMVEWGPPYPHSDWGFRQTIGGADTESHAYQDLSWMLENGELSPHDLLAIGKILHRYENMLERNGRSY